MAIKLNFKDVPTSFSIPDEGLYEATIFAADEKSTKKGDPMFVVRWKLADTGAIVYDNIPVMESTMWRVAQFMVALGFSDFGEEDFELDADDLVGEAAVIRIQHREYNGNTQANVSKYMPLNEVHSSNAPSDEEDVDFDSVPPVEVSDAAINLLETLDVELDDIIAANPDVAKITLSHVRTFMKNN